METSELERSDEIMLATEAAIACGDRLSVDTWLGVIRQRRLELSRECQLLQTTALRAENYLVTGDPDRIGRPEFES